MSEKNVVRAFFKSCIGKTPPAASPPVTKWLNGIIKEIADDSITIEYLVREDMVNPAKTLHGGIQAAIIDDLVGMTLSATQGQGRDFFFSINLSVNYLKKVKVGQTISAQSKIIRVGWSTAHVTVDISDENGNIISKASSNLCKQRNEE